jgi:phenylpropionate dioxygenase-like ring-hydroxylating dioxygenase large terminal subunit
MIPNFEPEDLFEPTHYADVRRPWNVAETLPGWCYTSTRFYQRESERIFFRYWNCIGHQSRVPEPGSYLAFDFMGVPLIVLRGADHEIRAFVNSCPHRGSQIIEAGEGACTRLQCPYHNWTFALDGSLYATPMFEESAVFKKADHGLRRIRLELWAGLMWVNFNPDGPSLLDHLGDLPGRTAAWNAEDMVCVARRTYPVAANWKLYVENFSDGYHVPFVHKTTLNRKYVSRRDFHDPAVNIGNYLMHYTRFEGTRGTMDGGRVLPELDLPPENKTGTFFPSVHANCMMGFAIDSVSATEVYPEGPEHTTLVSSFLVPKSTAELPDFPDILARYQKSADIVRAEDVRAAELQQLGLSSAIHVPGRFTPPDRLVHDYDLWILDHVIGNAGP